VHPASAGGGIAAPAEARYTWEGALEHAIEFVLQAGDRGGRARLKAAADQIEIVLRGRHML
jgi:hypothetical protein